MPDPKLHYSEQGSPRCGTQGQVTDKKSLVTCVRCRKAMKKRVNYMAQADTLFSLWIRQRDEICQYDDPGHICRGRLQCAHIHSRRYHTLRLDDRNAVALCEGAHLYFTHRPIEWMTWVESRSPGLYHQLAQEAAESLRRGEKVDWRSEIKRLEGLLQEVG